MRRGDVVVHNAFTSTPEHSAVRVRGEDAAIVLVQTYIGLQMEPPVMTRRNGREGLR